MLNGDAFCKRVGNMKNKAASLHCARTPGIAREIQEFSSHLSPRSLAVNLVLVADSGVSLMAECLKTLEGNPGIRKPLLSPSAQNVTKGASA